MKQAIKFLGLIAISAIACASVPAASSRGSIQGIVRDGQGNPLPGAAVLVLASPEDAKSEKVIKRANTDTEGKFVAAGILPGRYRVKAEATGFKPAEFAADVKPNKVTIFDSIKLRRINTLAEETTLNLDPKFAARRASSTIFQHNQSQKKETRLDSSIALTDRAPEFHGFVNAFSQTAWEAASETGTYRGVNFALTERIGKADVVISGQTGLSPGAPQRFQAAATGHASDRHRLTVALGYGRFTFSRRGQGPIGQFSVSATDTWQVSGPVLIVYGLEAARFTQGASGTSLLPRFGIAVDATARTRLVAAMTPGSSIDAQSKVNFESGEIVFSEPKPLALASGGEPVMDRSYRLQFGGQQILTDKSSVEMMAFFDTVSGHGVGLLAIPLEGPPAARTEAISGRARGLRVVYHHRINSVVEGSVGYAFGQGQRIDERGITEPAELFQNDTFHVFSARVDANFMSTGTKVSTVLRLAPERAIFAIDPFQGEIATYDPNISVSLTQELPGLGFMPGQWQAILDLRNLLDQQASIADGGQEIVASRYHRLIRVGVSLRF